jgi:hypothetical protein
MTLLRRVLYWEAALLVAGGATLAAFPGWVVESVFSQPGTEVTWVRIVGVQGLGFGLLFVVIAHRLEQLWWASWAFAITGVGVAIVSLAHALVGAPSGTGSVLWWTLGLVALVFTLALVGGLALAGTQRDPHDTPP